MSLLSRLKALVHLHRLESDLDEELRAHLEMRAADNLAAGMSPDEARYDARRRFGNSTLVKEDARAIDIVAWLETTGQNLRYAARMLRRSPGFTLVAILTLALGIGANVAIFTVVHAVLLQPLPYPHPEQLVRVFDDLRGSNSLNVGLSVLELWDLRDRSGVFQDISAIAAGDVNLTGADQPARIQLQVTSGSYFTMLAAQPQLGRVFTQDDEQPGFSEGVVLSDGFWRRTFGGDPRAIGKKIQLDGDLYTIIGIMPPGFHNPSRAHASDVDVWAAAVASGPPFPTPPQRSQRILSGAVARLKPGLTLEQAQARLNTFAAQLAQQYPTDYPAPAGWALRLVPLQEDVVGQMRTELVVLFAAVAFVLLIACVNLANLLLARAAGRQREMAIRLALGAGKGPLIAQLLAESILLSTLSGAVALGMLLLTKSSLLRLTPADVPRVNDMTLSPGVVLFAFLVSILTGVIFGLVPALQMVRPGQVSSLREGSRGAGLSARQVKVSRLLVASEIALSLVLLIGAGLLLRSFWNLLEVHPGFDPHRLMTARIWLAFPNNPAADPYHLTAQRAAFYQGILRRVRVLPGIEQAAMGSRDSLPMSGARNQSPFLIESHAAESERMPVAEFSSVSSDYFDVLRTPLRKGRVFTEADNATGQEVAVINEALQRQYWRDENPIGQHIKFHSGDMRTHQSDVTIVGIVGDIKTDGFDVASVPRIYVPTLQVPTYGTVVYVRTSSDPASLGESIRREVQAVDPGVPVFGVRTMDEVITTSLASRRFALELLAVFAAAALLLAAIGIYGVMAYTFSRRTNEIGIRMAMGAQRRDILQVALTEGTLTIAFGVVAGLVGSLLLTRFLASMLFSVKPTDPATFALIAALLAAVTLLACLVPALRATRVDPLIALRHE